MFCQRCGRQLRDGEICPSCYPQYAEPEAKTEFSSGAAPETQPVSTAPVGSRMTGFGPALTAAILAFIAFVTSYATLLVLDVALMDIDAGFYDEAFVDGTFPVCIFFALLAFGLSVPALILGIKSIMTFVRESKRGAVKPIATLVLGIASTALSPLTLLISFIIFCASVAMLATL